MPSPMPARAFSDVLAAVGEREAPRLSMGELVVAFGERAFGGLMLVVALVNLIPLPPGGTTLTGAPLLLLSMELAWGRPVLWLPRPLLTATMSRAAFRAGVRRLLPAVRLAERLTRPRLLVLTNRFFLGVIGLVCVVLSLVLVLPIPLGNIAPAATLALFSLGIMQRDGLAIVAGVLASFVSASLLAVAWEAIRHLVAMTAGLVA